MTCLLFAGPAAAAVDLSLAAPNGLSHASNFVSGVATTYNLQMQNVGSGTALAGSQFRITSSSTNLTFSGPISGFGGTFNSANCTGAGTQIITCTSVAPIAAGLTLSGTVAVNPTAAATATVTTVAQVIAAGDGNSANDFALDPTIVTPAPAPDLRIAKTGPASFTLGTNGSYGLTVTNNGSGPTAGAIVVTDTLDPALTYVAGSGATCSFAAPVVTCTVPGPIPAGGVVSFAILVKPVADNGALILNTATVTTVGDANPADNTSNTTSTPMVGLDYFTLAPCRVVDTRGGAPIGGPALQGQQTRTLVVASMCGIPTTARAVSITLAVTDPGAAGNLRLFPAGQAMPTASSINYAAGQTRANNAVIKLNVGGAMDAFVGQAAGTTVHLIIDVNGYFE